MPTEKKTLSHNRHKRADIYDIRNKTEAAIRNFVDGPKRPTYGRGMRNPWADRQVSKRNKELIVEYDKYIQFLGRSQQTRYKRFYNLARMTLEIKKDLDKLTREDVKEYIAFLNNTPFAPKTIQQKKVALKLFVKWLAQEKGIKAAKKLWAWLEGAVKTTLPVRSAEETLNVDANNLLSEEEALDFIRFCKGKDRAFSFVLFESGARIGELLPLKRKDVELVEGGYALLNLQGKTGRRKVPIKNSVPDLLAWMNSLPDDPDQDLWIIEGSRGAGSRYDYRAMMRHVYDLGKRWQATKEKPWSTERIRAKLHLHNWRHSRATILAKRGWSEYQMCQFFGWKIGSKVPGVYVALSGKDLMNRIRKDNGDAEEQMEPSKLATKTCPACGLSQSAANALCERCGVPLGLKAFSEWYSQKKEEEQRLKHRMESIEKVERRLEIITKALSMYEENRNNPPTGAELKRRLQQVTEKRSV